VVEDVAKPPVKAAVLELRRAVSFADEKCGEAATPQRRGDFRRLRRVPDNIISMYPT
jgi:hypothetical protein